MAVRTIVEFPDKCLLTAAQAVEDFDDALQILIDDMIETMRSENGLGLAANQIGVGLRIFVRENDLDRANPFIFINPEVIAQEGETILQEGCLSFPGIYVKVKRPEFVTVKALDRHGQPFELSESGYEARCVLHEIDHLNGVTFLDRLSPTKRKLALGKLKPRKKKA